MGPATRSRAPLSRHGLTRPGSRPSHPFSSFPLLAASLPVAQAGLTATSASPGNVLGTIRLEPPPSVATVVNGDGTIGVAWDPSPSAAYGITRPSADRAAGAAPLELVQLD